MAPPPPPPEGSPAGGTPPAAAPARPQRSEGSVLTRSSSRPRQTGRNPDQIALGRRAGLGPDTPVPHPRDGGAPEGEGLERGVRAGRAGCVLVHPLAGGWASSPGACHGQCGMGWQGRRAAASFAVALDAACGCRHTHARMHARAHARPTHTQAVARGRRARASTPSMALCTSAPATCFAQRWRQARSWWVVLGRAWHGVVCVHAACMEECMPWMGGACRGGHACVHACVCACLLGSCTRSSTQHGIGGMALVASSVPAHLHSGLQFRAASASCVVAACSNAWDAGMWKQVQLTSRHESPPHIASVCAPVRAPMLTPT